MKTALEILNSKIDFSKDGIIDREKAIEAMNEYAVQFIQPTKCWQCDGEGKTLIGICDNHTCQMCMGAGKLIILPMQQNT